MVAQVAAVGTGTAYGLLVGGNVCSSVDQQPSCVAQGYWRFDFATEKWTELATSGALPPDRHSHCGAASGEGKVIIFGGRFHRIWYQ